MSESLMSLISVFLTIFGFGMIIFIHELGHYLVGKWAGIKVERFSVGFGPAIFKRTYNGEIWTLSIIPFGGFVQFQGFDRRGDKPGDFYTAHPFKRILVVFAGPLMNFILAYFLYVWLVAMGSIDLPFGQVTRYLGFVDPKSEIYDAGVRPGDKLISYGDVPYTGSEQNVMYAFLQDGPQKWFLKRMIIKATIRYQA